MAFHLDRIHFPIHNENDNDDLSTFLISYPPTVNIQGINWICVRNNNNNNNNNRKRKREDDKSNIKNQNEKKMNVIDLTFSDDDENDENDENDEDKNDQNKNDNTNDNQHKPNNYHEESSEDILLEFATLGDQRISASLKRQYKDRLFASARDYVGKWMIFPTSENVQDIWNEIATKVYNGELGCSAKVSNKDPPSTSNNSSSIGVSRWNEDNYLICVYVDDFRDEEDVRRVLRVLLRIKEVKINAGFKVNYLGLFVCLCVCHEYYLRFEK